MGESGLDSSITGVRRYLSVLLLGSRCEVCTALAQGFFPRQEEALQGRAPGGRQGIKWSRGGAGGSRSRESVQGGGCKVRRLTSAPDRGCRAVRAGGDPSLGKVLVPRAPASNDLSLHQLRTPALEMGSPCRRPTHPFPGSHSWAPV